MYVSYIYAYTLMKLITILAEQWEAAHVHEQFLGVRGVEDLRCIS